MGVSGIMSDEDYLSFLFSNCFLVSAGNSDGVGDGLGPKVTLMHSEQSFSRDFSSNSSVVSQSS